MKKRWLLLIVCISLVLLLVGALIARTLLFQREPNSLMEEEELLLYIADLKGKETEPQMPEDLLWDPNPTTPK